MLDAIFAELPRTYIKNSFTTPTSFYLSLDDVKKTVIFAPEDCTVSEGKTVENADCICKTSTAFFLRIWQEGYTPGMGDFLKGTIKSNAPQLLQQFLRAHGKD